LCEKRRVRGHLIGLGQNKSTDRVDKGLLVGEVAKGDDCVGESSWIKWHSSAN